MVNLSAVQHDTLIKERRWLHQHAELSFQEHETSGFIADKLQEIKGLIVSRPTPTSVMAVLKTGKPGRKLAFRADIDALPIMEENDLPYKSIHCGVMHACGHDGHAAILLTTARILADMKDELCGEIRLIFQHAEELPPGGAVEVIKAGVLEGIDEAYGLHLTSIMPTGKLGFCAGAFTAATDSFEIIVKGKGGHSSMPQVTIDPIMVGAQIITSLQTIVSRSLKPSATAVLSVCHVNAGTAYNVIPDTMHIKGSVRSYEEDIRCMISDRIREISNGVAGAYGASIELRYDRGYDPVVNDADLTNMAKGIVEREFGRDAIYELAPMTPGDDFCYYGQKCPGFFLEVGAANESKGTNRPHHNPRYKLDEDALAYGVRYCVALLSTRCCKGAS